MTDEQSHEFTRALYGWITHTEYPAATPRPPANGAPRCSAGNSNPRFRARLATTTYSPIRARVAAGSGRPRQGEARESTPTVHVEDTQAAYDAALAAGAESVNPPAGVRRRLLAQAHGIEGLLGGSEDPSAI